MLAMIAVTLAAPVNAGPNLLPNSSFEEGEAGWVLWHEKPGVTSGGVESEAAFLGDRAFRVSSPGDAWANLHSDPFPCQPGAQYTLSVYAHITDGQEVAIALWGLDEAGELVAHGIAGNSVLPDHCPTWGHYRKTAFAPENCTQLKAHLLSRGGEVIWDAVKIEASREATAYSDGPALVGDGPRNLLWNPGFGLGTEGWVLWHQDAGQSDGGVEDGVYAVRNHGTGGANLYSDDVPCEPGETYTLSVWAKTQGARNVQIAGWARDAAGETLDYSIDEGTSVADDVVEYTRFTSTFRAPAGAAALRAHFVCNGGEVWWMDPQLEKGDAATEFDPGLPVYDFDTPARRQLARTYAEAIVREARLADLVQQCERLATYSTGVAMASAEAEVLLTELRAALQAAYLVPDFAVLDYARIAELGAGLETKLSEAWQAAGLEAPSFEPWQPALPAPLNKSTLAREILIFPCFTRQYHHRGDADWGVLEPFGFRLVSGWTGVGVLADGQRAYEANDQFLQANAEHGYGTDVAVDPAAIARWLHGPDEDEQVFLQSADGEWSPSGNCHNTINIWHPRVREEGKRLLTEYARRYGDDPNVVAIELTNEPSLTIEKRVEGYQYERVGVGGYSEAAREAWRGWLAKTHGTIDTLNARWNADYPAFAEVDPPADLVPPDPTSSSEPVACGAISDFQRFRAESHAEYFREMVGALRQGNPNAPVMSQLHHARFGRKDAAIDLHLMATVPGWDYLGTHDWPGDRPAVLSLYAASMNRYAKLPHWEDEFIWSQWERKGTPEPVMRAAVTRNLWRQIAWGKRGISLFNLESEWLHDSPASWNNSMLNIEADMLVPRYCTGAIPTVERKANLLREALIDTELANQGVAVLVPMRSVYGAAPDGRVERDGAEIAAALLARHWTPFMVPEERIVDGTEDLSQLEAIIAPWAVNVTD